MGMREQPDDRAAVVVAQLASLRQHQREGQRSPHKPLLVLLALGRLAVSGSSELPWSVAETALAELIAELAPRPGMVVPAANNISWHVRQVFKGDPLAALFP